MAFHAVHEKLHAVLENTARCAWNTVQDYWKCHGECFFFGLVNTWISLPKSAKFQEIKKGVFYFREKNGFLSLPLSSTVQIRFKHLHWSLKHWSRLNFWPQQQQSVVQPYVWLDIWDDKYVLGKKNLRNLNQSCIKDRETARKLFLETGERFRRQWCGHWASSLHDFYVYI